MFSAPKLLMSGPGDPSPTPDPRSRQGLFQAESVLPGAQSCQGFLQSTALTPWAKDTALPVPSKSSTRRVPGEQFSVWFTRGTDPSASGLRTRLMSKRFLKGEIQFFRQHLITGHKRPQLALPSSCLPGGMSTELSPSSTVGLSRSAKSGNVERMQDTM
ncbi:hypothetical protein TREES_T100016985 [Tupaia chinensis]|uniref:Uncharacterized protein n=1 Tax=Tupaia chinensis TaxID=246437 RepID=L9KVP6_TUPCH|nr:hypothetical protein TREES_T100016985 [Tupaia chinensis]